MEGRNILMEYCDLKIGKEDEGCRYGDKMYIVRFQEVPIFIGYFCGKISAHSGTYYVIQIKNSLDRIELYLPGVVKSEKELSSRARKLSYKN